MPLPNFNEAGDLPVGVHPATLREVVARFGHGSVQRETVTQRLLEIHRRAAATSQLQRFVVFGSYVTAKVEPNDVDVILVMTDEFELASCDPGTRRLFEHGAGAELGASIFWVRPGIVFLEPLDTFIAHWQVKRDQTRRGIVEIVI